MHADMRNTDADDSEQEDVLFLCRNRCLDECGCQVHMQEVVREGTLKLSGGPLPRIVELGGW